MNDRQREIEKAARRLGVDLDSLSLYNRPDTAEILCECASKAMPPKEAAVRVIESYLGRSITGMNRHDRIKAVLNEMAKV
jgi:hypothetical protein